MLDPTAPAAAVAEVPCEEDAALVADAVRAVSGRVLAMRGRERLPGAALDAARALVAATGDASRVRGSPGRRDKAAPAGGGLLAAPFGAMAEVGVVVELFEPARPTCSSACWLEHAQRRNTTLRSRMRSRIAAIPRRYLRDGRLLHAGIGGSRASRRATDSVRASTPGTRSRPSRLQSTAHARSIIPTLVFEDGLDAEQDAAEAARARFDWPQGGPRPLRLSGARSCRAPRGCSLVRDAVGAVYKLCETDRVATMKLVGPETSGKRSLPGRPVVFRRVAGDGPLGLVGQAGEPPPPGMVQLTGADAGTTERARSVARAARPDTRAVPSVATQALIDALVAQRVMMMSHRAEVTS
ncbi:MAG: hypothetical protein U0235_30325 [Polyangiaceae bacterium]